MLPAIRLESITKRFGTLEAVSSLTLDIEEGELFTLLGPSGCGKTTTLRLISGFEAPDAGIVRIGEQVVNHVPSYRRPVNTVFQNYALFPHLSVFENVAYGLRIKKIKKHLIREKVSEMLERIGLGDKADNYPNQISGGQKQRIALARALINEPKVLLLDEPLGALDAKLRHAMQLELKHMQQKLGITFIYVTHDQQEALVMSNRIAVMNAGHIVQVGSPREIFEQPNSRFVAEFIGTRNLLPANTDKDGDGYRIRLNNGPSIIVHKGITGENGTITIAIRPQKIRVVLEARLLKGQENILDVILQEVIYLGSLVRFVVQIKGGTYLEIETLPEVLSFDYHKIKTGQKLYISLPPEAILSYRD